MIPRYFGKLFDRMVGNDIIDLTFTVHQSINSYTNSSFTGGTDDRQCRCESREAIKQTYDSIIRCDNLHSSYFNELQHSSLCVSNERKLEINLKGYINQVNINKSFNDIKSLREYLIEQALLQEENCIENNKIL